MTINKLREALFNFHQANYGAKPGYILCHPKVRDELFASYNGPWIADPKTKSKPDTVMGLEIVTVDPRTHPEDFFQLVGPASTPTQPGADHE